jgi:hypothetical protein
MSRWYVELAVYSSIRLAPNIEKETICHTVPFTAA